MPGLRSQDSSPFRSPFVEPPAMDRIDEPDDYKILSFAVHRELSAVFYLPL